MIKLNTILYSGSGSSSHTYGNVASLIKEYILSQFEPNFFNHVFISTEHISRERRKGLINTELEMEKFVPPELAINPKFDELTNRDIFLKNTILTTNFGNVEQGISRSQLNPILRDKSKNIELAYNMDRYRVVFDVAVYLPTSHMQLDTFTTLQHQMNWTTFITINSSLESMIPRSLISYIAKIHGWDINDPNSSSLILRYLNSHSQYPITYKMRTSTSRDEFFMYYPVKLLITASDLTPEDGNKIGEVDDAYPIRFSMDVDFNLPVSYFLLGDINNDFDIKFSIGVEDRGSSEFIPIYTLHNAYSNFEDDGSLRVDNNFLFQLEEGGPSEDTDLSAILSHEMVTLINQSLAAGIDINTFFKIRVINGRELLEENVDWKMNWQSMQLTMFNGKTDTEYRLITYIDKYYVNTKIKDMLDGGITINNFDECDPLFE